MSGLVEAEKYLSDILPYDLVRCCLEYEGSILENQGRDWCTEVYTRAWQQAFGRTFCLKKALNSPIILNFYVSVAYVLRKNPINVKKSRSVKHREGLFQLIRKYKLEKAFQKYTGLQCKHFNLRLGLSDSM